MLSLRTFGEDICDFTPPEKKKTAVANADSAVLSDKKEEDPSASADLLTQPAEREAE